MIPASSNETLSVALLKQLRSIPDKGLVKLEIEMDQELRKALEVFAEKYASKQPLHIVEDTKEYTTNEAAEILRVSRSYLNKVIENGELPYRTVGAHKRIEARDLFRYKEIADRKSNEALKMHAQIGQRFADEG